MIANAAGGKLDSNWALYSSNLSCKFIICSPAQFLFPSAFSKFTMRNDVWQNQELTNLIISSRKRGPLAAPRGATSSIRLQLFRGECYVYRQPIFAWPLILIRFSSHGP